MVLTFSMECYFQGLVRARSSSEIAVDLSCYCSLCNTVQPPCVSQSDVNCPSVLRPSVECGSFIRLSFKYLLCCIQCLMLDTSTPNYNMFVDVCRKTPSMYVFECVMVEVLVAMMTLIVGVHTHICAAYTRIYVVYIYIFGCYILRRVVYTYIYIYIKCIVTNKYASRVLEYNNTNSRQICFRYIYKTPLCKIW